MKEIVKEHLSFYTRIKRDVVHKVAYLLAFILVISMTITGCGNELQKNEPTLAIDGVVEAKEVDVSSKIAGRIEKVNVQEGDTVKAGQVLAYIEINELRDKEKQAEAAVEAAQAQYNQAKHALLLQEKVSEADIQAAQAALEQAIAQYDRVNNGARAQEIEQAKAKLDEAKATLEAAEKSY
jgi:multidrug efflux pump subunit AcrA (membrane-fusion protein)